MHAFYNACDYTVRDSIFIVAVLAALAYGRWHYWWKTSFGRGRMALIVAIATVQLEPFVRSITGMPEESMSDRVTSGIGLVARAVVLIWLTWFLFRIISLNVLHARHPADAAEQGRRHLRQTPWATQEEIGRLIACWEATRIRPSSNGRAPGDPDKTACRRHLEQTPGASDEEIRELLRFWNELDEQRKDPTPPHPSSR